MTQPPPNPRTHCVKCNSRYGFADESCRYCGFAPCDNDLDEAIEVAAEEAYADYIASQP